MHNIIKFGVIFPRKIHPKSIIYEVYIIGIDMGNHTNEDGNEVRKKRVPLGISIIRNLGIQGKTRKSTLHM